MKIWWGACSAAATAGLVLGWVGLAGVRSEAAANRLLDFAVARLHEDPTDGRFGIQRMETYAKHGQVQFGTPPPGPTVVDRTDPKGPPHKWTKIRSDEPAANAALDEIRLTHSPEMSLIRLERGFWRMSRHVRLYSKDPESLKRGHLDTAFRGPFLAEDGLAKVKQLVESGRKAGKFTVQVEDVKITTYLRAVYASRESCYSCHKEVKRGQPIGIVALTLGPK